MSPGPVALAIAIVAAGVIATASRDARLAIVAATVVGVGSPVLTTTLPEPLPLAVRLLASILAGFLVWAAVRGQPTTSGSPIGWPSDALIAGGAGVAAASGISAVSAGLAGLPEAAAAGVALLAVVAAPLLLGRETLRLAIAAVLAVNGAWLLRTGIAGPPAPIDELAIAGLVATLGGIGAALIVRARDGSGGLELGARRPVIARERGPGPPADTRDRRRRDRSPTQ